MSPCQLPHTPQTEIKTLKQKQRFVCVIISSAKKQLIGSIVMKKEMKGRKYRKNGQNSIEGKPKYFFLVVKKKPLCYVTTLWLRTLEWTQYELLSVLTQHNMPFVLHSQHWQAPLKRALSLFFFFLAQWRAEKRTEEICFVSGGLTFVSGIIMWTKHSP